MKVRKGKVEFPVVLQKEPDGGYSVWCPLLPGCASQGETQAEALLNIREAIDLYLEPDELPLRRNQKLMRIAVG